MGTTLQIAPLLLPELLVIVQRDEYGETLQRKALAILHCIVGVMHMLTDSHPKVGRGRGRGWGANGVGERKGKTQQR